MNKDSVRRGTSKLRARARIIRAIGADLISNEVVALVELIKNSYDADARNVTIVFSEPLDISKGSISVIDDGIGMSLDVIKEAWLEPATISKARETYTAGGRRVAGEKGIGRFAAARIAQSMEMTSIAKGKRKKVSVRFDWGVFDNVDKYLDEIECSWEERPASSGEKHGTTLHLKDLNDSWGGQQFQKLRSELSRLVSPDDKDDEFIITLELPERFKDMAGRITPPPVLGRPHYKLVGEVDEKGQLRAEYYAPDNKEPVPIDDEILVNGLVPRSGPFHFEFLVWDRDPDSLEPLADSLSSTVRDLRRDLDSASGISIYRDSFRVLLADKDWLGLDLRRVQNPTMRLSNNQIVGSVFISADGNRGLRDQTNREGIVSSPGFEDFKEILITVLSKLEVPRDTHKRGQQPAKPTTGLFESLDIGPLRDYVEKRYPDDAELKAFLSEHAKAFKHGVIEVQRVLARYRRLATLGQIIDVVLHEGMTPVAAISNEVDLAKLDIAHTGEADISGEEMVSHLDTITQQAVVLSTLFKKLGPFSGRKRGRPQKVEIEKLIANAFELFNKEIDEKHVEVRLPASHTPVTVDEAEMQQIFVNLIDNALFWLERPTKEKKRIQVEVLREATELVIVFSDNGPGVREDVRERIFDPYFSTKPDGVGLGLTIAGETAMEYDGGLELISGGPLPGATFRITLRKRIGG
jgi:signal transduction histidine kinase